MQKVTVLIGLPGSGKTTYLINNKNSFGGALICDDYHRSSENIKDLKFARLGKSKYFNLVKKALQKGEDVVISDITYCRDEHLSELNSDIFRLLLDLGVKADIEYLYFENDPGACVENVLRRGRKNRIEKELKFIEEVGKKYKPPKDIKTVPVYKPEGFSYLHN